MSFDVQQKRFKIIHKFVHDGFVGRVSTGFRYLCNTSVDAEWGRTDMSGEGVSCKNCKRILRRYVGDVEMMLYKKGGR